jgi:hypothetical protein
MLDRFPRLPDMSKRITAALLIEGMAIAGVLTVALDMKAHSRVERLGGVNVWGYRGPVMRRKAPNEIRIATAGGDLAFGWGVAASETLGATVRQFVALAIDRPGGRLWSMTAVDLGALGLPPAQYAPWIQRFAYLQPDVICLVPDPRGHRSAGVTVLPDRASWVFRSFGYAPILPLVVEEKGARLHSKALSAVGSIGRALDHGIAAIAPGSSNDDRIPESTAAYVGSIGQAVQAALVNGARVVVVAPPIGAADDVADHDALAAMIATRFRGEPRVRFVDLGDHADMYDDEVWLHELVLSTAGHARAASYVTPEVLRLVADFIS